MTSKCSKNVETNSRLGSRKKTRTSRKPLRRRRSNCTSIHRAPSGTRWRFPASAPCQTVPVLRAPAAQIPQFLLASTSAPGSSVGAPGRRYSLTAEAGANGSFPDRLLRPDRPPLARATGRRRRVDARTVPLLRPRRTQPRVRPPDEPALPDQSANHAFQSRAATAGRAGGAAGAGSSPASSIARADAANNPPGRVAYP